MDGYELAVVVGARRSDGDALRVFVDWQAPASMSEVLSAVEAGQGSVVPHVALAPPADQQLKRTATIEVVRADEFATGHCEVMVSSSAGCLVERCQLQDGNWQATLRSVDGNQHREGLVLASSVMHQAVYVPSGKWSVTFEYRPLWLPWAVAASAFSWVIWLFLCWREPGWVVSLVRRGADR